MIERIRYGNTNTYLLRGTKANILIDTDYAGTLQGFYLSRRRPLPLNQV
ncbi:MAG: MBL fold metallo-hydrolase [Lachnospiraceae bacterium]|nr:MBL fold metallo-hydrolase [Lachnospiraceae bacterium]